MKINMGLKLNKLSKIKVDPTIRDYGNHPFFVKKGEASKKFMEKAGFPSDLLKINAEQINKF